MRLTTNTTRPKTDSANIKLDDFICTANKMLDRYTDTVMDALFDITEETSLVKEIKDILDELNIISCIGSQQHEVLEPFTRTMLSQSSLRREKGFNDSTRFGEHVEELRKSARSTYYSVSRFLI